MRRPGVLKKVRHGSARAMSETISERNLTMQAILVGFMSVRECRDPPTLCTGRGRGELELKKIFER